MSFRRYTQQLVICQYFGLHNIKTSFSVYFVRNLQEEVTVIEGSFVDIVCELSKENVAIQWLKDGSPIQFSCNRFTEEVEERSYKLIIRDTCTEDEGVFTLQADLKTSQGLRLKVSREQGFYSLIVCLRSLFLFRLHFCKY